MASEDRPENLPARGTQSGNHGDEREVEDYQVAEFSALRAEVVSHQDVQFQLVALAVIASGTLTTIGLQSNAAFGAAALFVYPIFAVFLAAAFTEQGRANRLIANYIRTKLEEPMHRKGWETHLHEERGKSRGYDTSFVSIPHGIFVGTEFGTMILGVSRLSGVLIFNSLLSPSSNQDLQAVHSFAIPLVVLLWLDLYAGIRTIRVNSREQRAWKTEN